MAVDGSNREVKQQFQWNASVGDDGRVTVEKEGPIGNVRVGGGGVGAGSGPIYSRHPRIRNNGA
jgi:hypothetical protein